MARSHVPNRVLARTTDPLSPHRRACLELFAAENGGEQIPVDVAAGHDLAHGDVILLCHWSDYHHPLRPNDLSHRFGEPGRRRGLTNTVDSVVRFPFPFAKSPGSHISITGVPPMRNDLGAGDGLMMIRRQLPKWPAPVTN